MTLEEAALRTMLRETTSFIFIKDRKGTYLAASDAFAALFGLQSGQEIAGRTDYELVRNFDHADHFAKADESVMASGAALYDMIEPNFTDVADVRWTSTSKYPIRNENGEVTGLITEGHVIDSRYERRTAYEYDLRSVVELSHDAFGAMMCDLTEGKIVEFHNLGQWRTSFTAGMAWDEVIREAKKHIHSREESVEELFRKSDYQNIVNLYRSNQRAFDLEYYWEDGDNSRWVRNDVRIFTNPDTGHILLAFVLHDVGDQYAERDELVRQAYQDSLTGLLNHEETVKRIRSLLQRGEKGCLIMMDVDNFKHINDSYGHPEGDRILLSVAEVLAKSFRTGDVLGRVGGDEYMVLLNGMSEIRMALEKAEDVLHKIADLRFKEPECRVTVSIGIALCREQESFEQLYSCADAMLYTAKRSGKGKVVGG